MVRVRVVPAAVPRVMAPVPMSMERPPPKVQLAFQVWPETVSALPAMLPPPVIRPPLMVSCPVPRLPPEPPLLLPPVIWRVPLFRVTPPVKTLLGGLPLPEPMLTVPSVEMTRAPEPPIFWPVALPLMEMVDPASPVKVRVWLSR